MGSSHTRSSWAHVAGATLGLSALLSLLVIAFAWPAANTEPNEVPVAVVAPGPAAAEVEQGLSRAGADAFNISRLEDRGAALTAIEEREVYGAIVVGPGGPEILTASAASPAVARMLGQFSAQIPADPAVGAPRVIDVVPLPADDPHGAGLAAGALPLVLGGIITAAALSLRVSGRAPLLAGMLGVAVAGGLATTAVLQFWLGSLDGSYWATSGVVALAIGAIATVLLGLHRMLGLPGLGMGAAVMLLLGNPLSGLTSAPELLPAGWGTLGQLLPPGAAGTALRSVSFFDGAGSGMSFAVLGAWLVFGLLLLAAPMRSAKGAVTVADEPIAA
jgi:hypothetical protein